EPGCEVTEPGWLRRAAPVEATAAGMLLPSGSVDPTGDSRGETSARVAADGDAAERGRLVHRLLQSLPDIAEAARGDAARHFLARVAKGRPEVHEELIREVMAILGDASFADVFGPGSRAEVPIVGRLPRGGGEDIVSGRIDRICVREDGILVVDFK